MLWSNLYYTVLSSCPSHHKTGAYRNISEYSFLALYYWTGYMNEPVETPSVHYVWRNSYFKVLSLCPSLAVPKLGYSEILMSTSARLWTMKIRQHSPGVWILYGAFNRNILLRCITTLSQRSQYTDKTVHLKTLLQHNSRLGGNDK